MALSIFKNPIKEDQTIKIEGEQHDSYASQSPNVTLQHSCIYDLGLG